MNEIIMYDVLILGSGPAGLTAALYCARAGKKTLVLGGDRLGGQTAGIAVLENYPGWAGSGLELAEFMKKQAETFGAEIKFVSAKEIAGDAESAFNILCDDGKRYVGKVVIIATGASPRKLEIDGARELFGRGVSYCATCDGFFYYGKDVVVMGGGNSALNDALYLADIAKNVKIVYHLLPSVITGKSIINVEPLLTSLLTDIFPPWSSTSSLVIVSPSPVDASFLV